MNGKPILTQYTANYDGKDHPVTGNADYDATSLKRLDAYTVEFTRTKAGKVVQTGTNVVATDGKTRTVTTKVLKAPTPKISGSATLQSTRNSSIPARPTPTHTRCGWARTPLSIAYHDAEWGVPVHDDRRFFEFLTLEGAQAGLSWETILKKREAYRDAFVGFDPAQIARFTSARIERLLRNPGIVRNRLKIDSTVGNAKAFLAVQDAFGSFDAYVWDFVGGAPRVNQWRSLQQVPARTVESDALSRDLLPRGFKFVGSTICYAFMQAVGIVNDHSPTPWCDGIASGSVGDGRGARGGFVRAARIRIRPFAHW